MGWVVIFFGSFIIEKKKPRWAYIFQLSKMVSPREGQKSQATTTTTKSLKKLKLCFFWGPFFAPFCNFDFILNQKNFTGE